MRYWLLLCLAACAPSEVDEEAIDASRGDGKADGVFVGDDSPEQFGALRVANELDERALVRDAHLGSRAAKGLLRFRAGKDRQLGTADDWRFESLEELDSVPYVGDSTISKLAEHAADRGWIPATPTLLAATEGELDPCGAIELRYSGPLDPESVDVQTDGFSTTLEGDRVIVRRFDRSADTHVYGVRAAGGSARATSTGLQLRLGAARSQAITSALPAGDGVAPDAAIQVSFCGVADVSATTLRILDGGAELPMREPTVQPPYVWRRPAAPLAPGHEYEAVVTWSGGERRWRFRTSAHAWRQESFAASAAPRLHASADGTVVRYWPGGEIEVGRLGGSWSRVPDSRNTVAAFAQDGGGVRAVRNTQPNAVSAGTWTAAGGWQLTQISVGFGIAGFLDATWVAYLNDGGAYVAHLEGDRWLSERIDGTSRPVVQSITRAPDGQVWMLWQQSEGGAAEVSRRSRSGWTRHALIPGLHGAAQLALGGELHVVVDDEVFGLFAWRLDRDSRDLPRRRLGGAAFSTPARPQVLTDAEGNLLVLWQSKLGGWTRWYRGDLGAWTAREPFPAGSISGAAAAPDGSIYVVAAGGLWRGSVASGWERLVDAPAPTVAVLAGQVVVYGDRGLWTLTE